MPVAKTPVFFVVHSGEEARSRTTRDEEGVLSKQSNARSSRWRDVNSTGLTVAVSHIFTFTKVNDIYA